jgi:hypothetical protein
VQQYRVPVTRADTPPVTSQFARRLDASVGSRTTTLHCVAIPPDRRRHECPRLNESCCA